MAKLVTKQSMINALNDNRPGFKERYIGKALVAIFNNQTEDEKSANSVDNHNNIGFTGADGKDGSITAKYFLKHGTLLDWMVDNWTKDFRGAPRITKYHRQLNAVAEMKATKIKKDNNAPFFQHDQEVDAKHVFLGHTSKNEDVYFSIKFSEVIIRFGDRPDQYRAMDLHTARQIESYRDAVNLVNQFL